MFDFFVERAIRVVMSAQNEAHRLNHPFMGGQITFFWDL
ncbi:hypothetical protein Lepto7375DRAFT_1144 [Leptolyngbya sp. PCC 7375]|nr:hypothetical protein Lepto7375DRAFT_1144 [Leptolyngbya sp. PCC 7375]